MCRFVSWCVRIHAKVAWSEDARRQRELALVEQRLEGALPWVGSDMNATIHGRVKSVRSTFEKVALRGKDLDDLLALRIIVEDEADEAACIERCHHIETLVQSLWPGGVVHVKDYVASPRENGYQSASTGQAAVRMEV